MLPQFLSLCSERVRMGGFTKEEEDRIFLPIRPLLSGIRGHPAGQAWRALRQWRLALGALKVGWWA